MLLAMRVPWFPSSQKHSFSCLCFWWLDLWFLCFPITLSIPPSDLKLCTPWKGFNSHSRLIFWFFLTRSFAELSGMQCAHTLSYITIQVFPQQETLDEPSKMSSKAVFQGQDLRHSYLAMQILYIQEVFLPQKRRNFCFKLEDETSVR